MVLDSRLRQFLLALCVTSLTTGGLTACGGSSSDNVSPGQIVIDNGGGDNGGGDNGGGDNGGGDNGGGDNGGGGNNGDVIQSVIPDSLSSAISASGETASDGREIYDIDVTQLPGGKLNPDGLLLGNDVVFRITGGALRVSND